MHETVYMRRDGGDCLSLSNVHGGESDVMVFAGEPIGAPVAAQGTMVMNSEAEVQRAYRDYAAGTFGSPWDHRIDDREGADLCGSVG